MMINIRETPEQKVYLTADPHLGHQGPASNPVWKSRGHPDVKTHDDNWMDTTNQLVRPNDVLIVIGDFCLNTTLSLFNEYLSRIQCQNIYHLWGNHNNPHEKNVYRPAQEERFVASIPVETYPFRYRNMVFLPNYVEAVLNGQFMVLFHYPIAVWNENRHGAWMLCGHSHYSFPNTRVDAEVGKILDVGWDGHCKPWSLSEIAAVMNSKTVMQFDHH